MKIKFLTFKTNQWFIQKYAIDEVLINVLHISAAAFCMKEYDTPMFTAHRSIGKSSENLLGFASEVFFGFSILLLALNIGIYHTGTFYCPATYCSNIFTIWFWILVELKIFIHFRSDEAITRREPSTAWPAYSPFLWQVSTLSWNRVRQPGLMCTASLLLTLKWFLSTYTTMQDEVWYGLAEEWGDAALRVQGECG